ncbi:glycosyltransferase family 2 protein [Pectobacterium parvum]|uniref:glycosyltransferase family 2 protein n=1 Tax=Pectobacterium parvum TaxID=2778550 RepID=UPI001E5ECAD5|nr:glycosyltransferase family 2 protein [Pectobacterium parvum]UFK40599.1 glycosyltransferase family 2 protein [Pectobacterium parvum]
MKKPDVSIIIVSFNTLALTIQTIDSIIDICDENIYEIIVVDNSSSDGSEFVIKKKYPSVTFIQSGENLGFGKANNIGALYASGEFLLFLNSDVILLNDICTEFKKVILSYKKNDIIGASLYDVDLKPNTSFCRAFPGVKLELLNLIALILPSSYMFANKKNKNIIIDGPVSGACFFLSRDTFRKINGFDPDYFMYYEETDLFLRAKKIGSNIISSPFVRAIHLEGGSEGIKIKTLERGFKSKSMYYKKNLSKIERITCKVLFFINAYLRMIFFFKNPSKKNFWKTLLDLENKYL